MRQHSKGTWGGAAFAVLMVMTMAGHAAYPERPIRMIVPQAVGSSTDNVARIVSNELTREAGVQIVADNRPGAALQLGMELTAKSPADGYTIGYAPIGALVIGPHLFRKPPVNVFRDLAPVSQTITGHMMMLAGMKTPFRSVQDVFEYARKNPGKLFNASSSNGSPGHIGFELFKTMMGINITHVPYKGGPAAIADLVAGQVQLMMEGLNSATGHIKAGRARGLAVTGPQRSKVFPDVPTMEESGVKGYVATTWHGVVVPAGAAPGVVRQLNTLVHKAVHSPGGTRRILALGSEPLTGSPDEFWSLVRTDYDKWRKVIQQAGARID